MIADSETVPSDHRRRPDPDALDPGQHRQAQLHDQPDQLQPVLGRLAGDRRPGHRRRLLSSYFHVGQLRGAALQAEDGDQADGRPQEHRSRSSNPALAVRPDGHAPGDANIKSLAVTLPSAFEIDQRHLGNLCSEKELAATQCAGRQPIGKATTTTPLLEKPLSGPVYAVSGSGGLPRLAFILNGQVDLVPRADTETVTGGRLQTTVPVVPDAPIGHFSLTVFGGKRGYLANTRNLCTHVPITTVAFTGQNGKSTTQRVKTSIACGAKGRKKKNR